MKFREFGLQREEREREREREREGEREKRERIYSNKNETILYYTFSYTGHYGFIYTLPSESTLKFPSLEADKIILDLGFQHVAEMK